MNILLIEDDLDDIELLQEALHACNVSFMMTTIHDGEEAIDYLHNSKEYPDLIILDFNLPKVHGRKIILKIKSTAGFQNVPLLILTTSSAKEDIDYAYANGADSYLVKPSDIEKMNQMVETIVTLAKVN